MSRVEIISAYKQRLEEYYKNPIRCEVCRKPVPMAVIQRGGKGCSGICARILGNAKRKWNFERKIKHANSI
jgi:predicted nucleic acid-binding Zn ribbon protein